MGRKSFTEEQIGFAPEAGRGRHPGRRDLPQAGHRRGDVLPLEAALRRMGVSEIRRLRQVVADLTQDKAMLQDVVRRKW